MARQLAERGEIDAALAKFEAAIAACPGRLDWVAEYGRAAITNQRWHVAKSAFDRALAGRADVAAWYASRARALVGLGRHDEAVRDYRAAVALNPRNGGWFVALGRALNATGAVADAIAAFDRAVETLGAAIALRAEPRWYEVRARGLAELGRTQEAIADLRRALEQDPTQAGWWARLAHLLASTAGTDEAIEAYRAALALDDRRAKDHARLGRLLARRGDLQAAIAHLAQALELDGAHPDWRADLDQLRELASRGCGAPPSGEKDARWYDTFYEQSDKYRLGYAASPYWPVWQRILERLATFGKPAILEIGCGPGQLAAAIRDRVAVSAYLGIDFSATAIEMARRTVPDFRFVVGDALAAPDIEQFSYDVVVCTEVLEHIERDRDVIRRWRPGAAVIATVPSYASASHVRHFRHVDEVRVRYAPLIDDLSIEPIAIGRQAHLFLMSGRIAAGV